MLEKITKGVVEIPHLILIYGGPGVGKTTFAAGAPSPLILGVETGSSFLDVSRLQIKSFQEVMQTMRELFEAKHDFKTVAVDSLDWLEPLIWEQVCVERKLKSVDDLDYGKGYQFALEYWKEFARACQALRHKLNVILVGHSIVKTCHDPHSNQSYDRYELKLNAKAAALMTELADCIFFATWQQTVLTQKNEKVGKAFGTGERIMYTERRPGFTAKSRHKLPFEMPLSWQAFDQLTKNQKPKEGVKQ